MFWQNFKIYEKELAEGSAFLVYNGICNGQNLQKPKIFSLGAKTELHCNSKNNKSQINPIFLDQTNFFS